MFVIAQRGASNRYRQRLGTAISFTVLSVALAAATPFLTDRYGKPLYTNGGYWVGVGNFLAIALIAYSRPAAEVSTSAIRFHGTWSRKATEVPLESIESFTEIPGSLRLALRNGSRVSVSGLRFTPSELDRFRADMAAFLEARR